MFKIYDVISTNGHYADKGTKVKYWYELNGKNSLIKMNRYENDIEVRSLGVSEKIFSEIANYLEFNCVSIDFIKDENGKYGIASYDYKLGDMNIISGDDLYIMAFLPLPPKSEKRYIDKNYFYEDIQKILKYYNATLLKEFNKIILMDALTGEMDRHYENWGIYETNNQYFLLPMFDNASCLLHQFRKKSELEKFIQNGNLNNYSDRSFCKIKYKGKKIKHFDFISDLLNDLPQELSEDLKENILKLKKISDDYINDLINKIPEELCSLEHKRLIVEYIIIRRDKLLSLVGEYK